MNLPERKKPRLKGWNYSAAGCYFVTICTQGKQYLFWEGGRTPANGARAGSKPTRTPLPEVIRQFKTVSARKINQMRGTPGQPVWQRPFYDHIIRDAADYLRAWEYIDTDPARWREDECYVP